MTQYFFPIIVSLISDANKTDATYNNAIDSIFLAGVSDEERDEIEFTSFILEADLDKFLDPSKDYDIVTLTNRNQ